MSGRGALVALVGIALVLAPGCIGFGGPEKLRRALVRESGAEVEREFGIRIGPIGTAIARAALRHSDEDVDLEGVRRIAVGIYAVRTRGNGLDHALPGPDWQRLVRVREDDGDVMVLARERDGEVKEMLVVVAESDEWVLVRMRGNLTSFLESNIEWALREADHDELVEPVLAEYREGRGGDVRKRDV